MTLSSKVNRVTRIVIVGGVVFLIFAGLALWNWTTPQKKQQNIEPPNYFGLFKITSITVADKSAPLLTLDQSSSINLQYLNLGSQPVTGARVSADLVVAKGLSGTKVFTDFKERVSREEFDSDKGPTYGP